MGEFFEKGVNWVQGEGFYSNKEIAVNAALAELERQRQRESDIAKSKQLWEADNGKIMDRYLYMKYAGERDKLINELGVNVGAVEHELYLEAQEEGTIIFAGEKAKDNTKLDRAVAERNANSKWFNQIANATNVADGYAGAIDVLNQLMQTNYENSYGPSIYYAAVQQTIAEVTIDEIERSLYDDSFDDRKELIEKIGEVYFPESMLPNPNYNPSMPYSLSYTVIKLHQYKMKDFIDGNSRIKIESYLYVERIIDAVIYGTKEVDKLYDQTKGYKFNIFGIKFWRDTALDWMSYTDYKRLYNLSVQYNHKKINMIK